MAFNRPFSLILLFAFIFWQSAFAQANLCASHFETKIQTELTSRLRSQAIWRVLDQEISKILAHNFLNPELYPRNSALYRTMTRNLGIKVLGRSAVTQILQAYNRHMDRLIWEKRISAEDVLRPAFVLVTSDKKVIWRKFGEEIPEGAKFLDHELPNRLFEEMILEGYFPMGNASETLGGVRKVVFEHDLGHLTSFIDKPELMGLLRKLFQDRIRHPEFMARHGQEKQFSKSLFQERVYFYFEALTVVNPETKNQMIDSLMLSDSMRSRIDEITPLEMYEHLMNLTDEQRRVGVQRLLDHADEWFTPFAGAARNVGERNSTFHNRYYGFLHRAKALNSIESLAIFQLSAIRLRNVTIRDWFDLAFSDSVPETSPVYPYYSVEALRYVSEGAF